MIRGVLAMTNAFVAGANADAGHYAIAALCFAVAFVLGFVAISRTDAS